MRSGKYSTSAKLLRLTQESIILSAKTADRLCDEGVLNQEQCNQCSSLYAQSKDVYKMAIETELLFIDASLADEPTDLFIKERDNTMMRLLGISAKFKELSNEY